MFGYQFTPFNTPLMSDSPLRLVPTVNLDDAEALLNSFPPAGPPREDELRKVEALDALTLLVEDYGAKRVQSWLRNIAALKGESLT